ncbi:MAG TPA: DUF4124 domain-containing protein [Burkholderiaceae bacterium]|nr:DUF4124 domain-containing protein [Burkholderiaceae bacterium]
MAALPAGAQTQWKWRGANGKVQYSDRPPPAEVAEKDILGRPAGARRPEVQEVPAAASAVAAAVPGRKASDPALEAKRREAELAEKAKQKAEEERLEKQRAENCSRARSYAKSLQDGVRVSRTNDKGENEILSDTQRAQEIARTQQVMASDCK